MLWVAKTWPAYEQILYLFFIEIKWRVRKSESREILILLLFICASNNHHPHIIVLKRVISHHALLSEPQFPLPPAEGNLGLFSVLQTIKTRRSPRSSTRQHLRSQPGIRRTSEAWGGASELRYGREAATRHVAADMPAHWVYRSLLLGWMVWEALAKSLPDLPVGESPYVGGGCSTMRRWEWLHFYGL